MHWLDNRVLTSAVQRQCDVRAAVVGSYGNGKTTLSTALAERLGIPRVHATPMVLREGASRISLERCNGRQLVQLVTRRLIERVAAESMARQTGFVSDGSVLHEFVYADTRLAFGLHPSAMSRGQRREASVETVALEAIGKQVTAYAKATYDAIVLVPNERRLADAQPPISETFRSILDASLLRLIKRAGIPYVEVFGNEAARLTQAVNGISAGREPAEVIVGRQVLRVDKVEVI